MKKLIIFASIIFFSCQKGGEPTPVSNQSTINNSIETTNTKFINEPLNGDYLTLGCKVYTTIGTDTTFVGEDTIHSYLTQMYSNMPKCNRIMFNSCKFNTYCIEYCGADYINLTLDSLNYKTFTTEKTKIGGLYSNSSVNYTNYNLTFTYINPNPLFNTTSIKHYYYNALVSYDDLNDGKHYVYKITDILRIYYK